MNRGVLPAVSRFVVRSAGCLAVVAATVIVWPAQSVNAGAGGEGSVDDEIITAEVRFDAPPTESACTWEPVAGVQPVTVQTVSGAHTETLVYRSCDNRVMSYHWVRNSSPGRVAESSRSRVSRLVNMIAFRTAPSLDNMVVTVGTWFWVPRQLWRPVSVTAWIMTTYGPVSVTTTARPHRLVYSPGDGNAPVRCAGPGRPWIPRLGDTATSPCMYTYGSASHTQRTGTYRARASIVWKVSFRSNLGIGGPLPGIRTSLPLTARVNELQVLVR